MQLKKNLDRRFSQILIKWHHQDNDRKMPWKGEKDPYKIWLSEVILQQTRVEQGLKYYKNFIAAFPDIHALANASDHRVYKLWEGLGYYTRCRNLIDTARYISAAFHGNFPRRYEEIRTLKGIGPYTASAISSFAFNEPRAVVDGNVFRVLSRIFGIELPIDSTDGKKYFNQLANELIDKQQPALFNQAIMDFGAVVCKPAPQCQQCPFSKYCHAFLNNTILLFPVKTKKITIKKRWFNYLVLEYRGTVAIRQRTEKDIWHNLFEFLLIESHQRPSTNQLLKEIRKKGWLARNGFRVISVSPVFSQQLSHQKIEGEFTTVKLDRRPVFRNDVLWIKKTNLKRYPFPKFINQYVQQEQGLH